MKVFGKSESGEILQLEIGNEKIPTTVIEKDFFTIENKRGEFRIFKDKVCFSTSDWKIIMGWNNFKIFNLRNQQKIFVEVAPGFSLVPMGVETMDFQSISL